MTMTSGVSGPTRLSGPGSDSGATPTAAADNPLLPEPIAAPLGGDSMAALAVLLTQADEQDRTQARTLEQTADNAATKDDNQQVEQMRQKASDDESAALWSGVGTIAGGAFALGAAFVAPPTTPTDGAGGVSWHGALDAASRAAPGLGATAAAGCKAGGDEAGANAAQLAAQAQAQIRSFNAAHDDAQAASDSLQKVAQFLAQIEQTQNATRLSAATCRG